MNRGVIYKRLSNGNNSAPAPVTTEISEQAQKAFQEVEELREKQSRFLKLQSGETRTIQFDPEKFNISEDEFDGKKTKRVHYEVTDPKSPLDVKILPMSPTNAGNINALLKKGYALLEVKRIGSDRNTKYTFAPA